MSDNQHAEFDPRFGLMFRPKDETRCEEPSAKLTEAASKFAARLFRKQGAKTPQATPEPRTDVKPVAHWQVELSKLNARYGSEKASQLFLDGKTFADALEVEANELKAENAELRLRLETANQLRAVGEVASRTVATPELCRPMFR